MSNLVLSGALARPIVLGTMEWGRYDVLYMELSDADVKGGRDGCVGAGKYSL